jgi:hypothetical protein
MDLRDEFTTWLLRRIATAVEAGDASEELLRLAREDFQDAERLLAAGGAPPPLDLAGLDPEMARLSRELLDVTSELPDRQRLAVMQCLVESSLEALRERYRRERRDGAR